MIALAETADEIRDCFPVMAELRPHLDRDGFVSIVERLREVAGFRIAYLSDDGVKAVAGFRISEWLARGRYLEIEDLVTTESGRSRGYGGALFDWLVEHASASGCAHLRLLSATSRTEAHRFYVRKGMEVQAHYFDLDLGGR